ncbi:hypothetical protein NQ318_012824 [Aromia moschata]|uniref:Integrase p58-like C-terminal domain-containing protein n=1 Tax=Aromia moschata TaxID=1265417 RepID=A0AAV8XA88_9CUCU|nr:hypothetical protein NQ318_012824 [Aromia moschata]
MFLLDTGATKTIIKPDIAIAPARITPSHWRLRTATGDPASICGETNVTIVIGNVSFENRALVAEIEDELILGMDIMNTKGFEVDFKNSALKINGEEFVLHRKTDQTIRVNLAEDTAVPEQSEMILIAHLDGNPCVGNAMALMVFEPRSHEGERNSVSEVLEEIHNGWLERTTSVLYAKEWTTSTNESVPSIQGASDRMKETYNINANDGIPARQRRRGLSPKLKSSWEGPYEVVTQINDVVYRIQKLPRGKPRVVNFNRLAPFTVSNEEQAEDRIRHVSQPDSELFLKNSCCYILTARELVTVSRSLNVPRDCTYLQEEAFGQLEELRRQRPEVVGRVLQITVAQQEKERWSVFYLVTKQLSHHKPTYQNVWDTLVELRDVLLSQNISSLAIPKIASGLDGLDWRVIRSMPGRSSFPVYWNRNPGMLLQPQGDRPMKELWTVSSTERLDARMGHAAGIVMDQRMMIQFGTKCF